MTVEVRPATEAEVPAAVEVWRAAERARSGGDPPEADERAVALYTRIARYLLVGVDGGAVVSLAVALQAREDDGAGPPIDGLCHVAMLFVEPRHWGRGVGTATFDALLAAARGDGYDAAQLWVQRGNAAALALFGRRGFVPTGRERAETREVLLLLRAPLGSAG